MTDPLARMGPAELFHHLWSTKYGPRMAETVRTESERRADAFADNVTFTVCGEELRLMTPRDLLMLDGFENAFVCGRQPTEQDLQWFIWTLNSENDGSRSWRNLWRKGRCYARFETRPDFLEDVAEVYEYLDRLWLDTPADPMPGDGQAEQQRRQQSKPATVYCLAPLLVNVAGIMGAVDPMSGRLLADTPIPRLLQYQRSALERKTGEQEAGSFDSWRQKCVNEVNQIVLARQIAARAAKT